MPSQRTEIEVLQDIDKVISKERQDKSKQSLSSFIKFYFPHLTPNTTPPFHHEILQLLQNSIIPSEGIGLNDTHKNIQVHSKVHELRLKGAIAHGEGIY